MRAATVLFLLLTAHPALAEDDAEPAVDDTYETVVTGLRLPRPVRDTPGTVTVISRAEIERSPRRTADDLVRTIPSAATFRRSSSLVADPTSQGANLRGLGPSGVSRALVLQDGVPLNDPFGGWVYWRAIPLLTVDRIEIAPGGGSALFGNFALGGVTQIVSRDIEDDGPRLEAALSTGTLMTHRAAARATDRVGAVGVALDADLLDSDGYQPVAAYDAGAVDGPAPSRHLGAGARVELGERLALHGRFFDQSLDAGTRYTTADVRVVSYGASWRDLRAAGTLAVSAFGGQQWFWQGRARVDEDRSSAEPSNRQRTPSNSQGASASWTWAPWRAGGEHTTQVGLDALRVAGASTDTITPAEPMPGSLIQRTAGGEQRSAGLFAQDTVALGGGLDVSAALRVDVWQDVDGERVARFADGGESSTGFPDRGDVQLDPRLGLLQRIGEHLSLRASGYRAFRAPTLNELYRSFQVGTVLTEANRDLEAETLWGAEAGPALVLGGLVARATGFWNVLDAPIQNVTLAAPLPSGATRQRQNLGRARVRGVELEASWRPSRRWIATGGYTFVAPVVTSAPAQPDLVGNDLAQDPRHRATATVSFEDERIVSATVQARLVGRQYEDDLNTLVMDRFVVIDATASRRLRDDLDVFVGIENALDATYLVGRAGVDTVGAPRMIYAGVRFDSGR